jgi:predicted Zn finger-like uncharacterized protein
VSLATCCTACGTVFRVVQDQLKVSEGWVRCGRCNEVFNALEGLFDLERDAPPSASAPLADSPLPDSPLTDSPFAEVESSSTAAPGRFAPPAVKRAPRDFQPVEPGEERHDPSLVERLGAELFPDRVLGGSSAGASSRFTALEPFEIKDSRIDSELLIDGTPLSRPLDSELPPEDSLPVRHDTSAAPEFLRRGEQGARWRQPWMRALLSFSALALLAALVLQVGHHFRDGVAARWPASMPWLAQWCGLLNCSIAPLRRIDDIAVESTTFARTAGPDQFRVAVVLRNRGSLALAVPSVDLSLTDAAGGLLVRKSLSPQDFRVASNVIEPGGETQLQLVLAAGTPLVTGYTVEIFYP